MREHLYRALTTPHGIVLFTDDPQRLVQRLNTERRKANDPNLKRVVIATSRTAPECEVWLILKEPEGAEETGQAPGDGNGQAL